MNQFEVIAETRKETGTPPSRRLRKAGKIPGVLYGADQDATPILMDENAITKQLEHEAFFSHILNIKVDGEDTQAVIKALQRDPATSKVAHLDFLRVSSAHEIEMNVPLHFINEETCPGKRAGGVVSHLEVDLEITCLPKDLPEYIEVDMSNMDIGGVIHLSEIKLPEGVRLSNPVDDPAHDHPVVTVQEPQKLDLGEEPEAEEALAGELAEGEEGAEEGAEPEEGAREDAGEDARKEKKEES
ncbi:MAG: 50S ribosomal protein L25/general stress protein Ctc [Gammaproteobacteria bacterium]|nr:50S ribosomal protein L25/general stress protein Ctc [Gammaproteobacteria bacterium]